MARCKARSLPESPRTANVRWHAHGTYARKTPRGTQIARWYCPESHMTFSLLPDCLAARLPGTLDEVEQVVAHADAGPEPQRGGRCSCAAMRSSSRERCAGSSAGSGWSITS